MGEMSKLFRTVTRKQCCHCGLLFVTERHDCKFDPEKRNCLTCQHNLGQRVNCDGEAYFECEKGDKDGVSDLIVLISCHWNLKCDDWEKVELVEKARNIREAKGNQLRRLCAEANKKLTDDLKLLSGGEL